MNTVVEVSSGMSVMNECYDCMTIADYDVQCRVCDESDEARVDELAWNHRADERLSEGDVITDLTTPPSATEWVGSHTRQSDGTIRDEFVPATYNLADRCPGSYFLGKHLFDLDDILCIQNEVGAKNAYKKMVQKRRPPLGRGGPPLNKQYKGD